MSPPSNALAPPKSDPISIAALSQHDGSDPNKPIYLAIKGTVFDVTAKKEMYGPGGSYNIFAGKDGSVGLGTSRLLCLLPLVMQQSMVISLTDRGIRIAQANRP
jgi:membrane-associated progesterone receptor component